MPSAVRISVRTWSSLIGSSRARCRAGGEIGGDLREALAGAQPAGALDMGREILVAELEPGLAAERRQRLHEVPGLAGAAPAGLGIVEPGERVHDGVEVGRDVEAEMLEIIAGIRRHGERARRQHAIEAERRAWRRRRRRTARGSCPGALTGRDRVPWAAARRVPRVRAARPNRGRGRAPPAGAPPPAP